MITEPLEMPAAPAPRQLLLRGRDVVGTAQSPFTLSTQVQAYPGQRWEAEIVLPPLVDRSTAEPWISFLHKLRGPLRTFILRDPTTATPRGFAATVPGDLVVDGSDQVGETLNVQGAPFDAVGYLLAGDLIQLGSGMTTRLHRVLDDVDIDGTGRASLTLWPAIRHGDAPLDSAQVLVSNCGVLMRSQAPAEYTRNPDVFASGVTIPAIEAI